MQILELKSKMKRMCPREAITGRKPLDLLSGKLEAVLSWNTDSHALTQILTGHVD